MLLELTWGTISYGAVRVPTSKVDLDTREHHALESLCTAPYTAASPLLGALIVTVVIMRAITTSFGAILYGCDRRYSLVWSRV